MAFKSGKTRVLVDEAAKFGKTEIEFLLTLIQESMIPGKFLQQAMDVVIKLRNQYKFIDQPKWEVKKTRSIEEEVKERAKAALKEKEGELWIRNKEENNA